MYMYQIPADIGRNYSLTNINGGGECIC